MGYFFTSSFGASNFGYCCFSLAYGLMGNYVLVANYGDILGVIGKVSATVVLFWLEDVLKIEARLLPKSKLFFS